MLAGEEGSIIIILCVTDEFTYMCMLAGRLAVRREALALLMCPSPR